MNIKEFDFDLPEELIAHEPLKERDKCRLLVVNRASRTFEEFIFRDIVNFLNEGDVLVLNDSGVIKSRVYMTCKRTGRIHEVLFTKFLSDYESLALIRNARRVKVGDKLVVKDFEFEVSGVEEGLRVLVSNKKFGISELSEVGEVPLPPYIEKKREKLGVERVKNEDEIFYQTVYKRVYGSIASPTAGLHFTEELLKEIENKGVVIKYVTLHVGLGTFEPIKTEKVEDVKLHSEFLEVSQDVIDVVNEAKAKGKKVVAVGTTVTRALETTFSQTPPKPYIGETSLFIYPRYKFKVIDALVTNFHLPRSSLILLVSAFADKDLIMSAYKYAIEKKFRFYSYGDAMLIL